MLLENERDLLAHTVIVSTVDRFAIWVCWLHNQANRGFRCLRIGFYKKLSILLI